MMFKSTKPEPWLSRQTNVKNLGITCHVSNVTRLIFAADTWLEGGCSAIMGQYNKGVITPGGSVMKVVRIFVIVVAERQEIQSEPRAIMERDRETVPHCSGT